MPIGQLIDPSFDDQEDPNIVILNLLKEQWGSGRPNFKLKKAAISFVSQESFYSGEDYAVVVWWEGDAVGRWGIPSTRRYHHSKHRVWVFAKSPNDRWIMCREVMRILQRFQNHPSKSIERLDYYDWVPWQQESPNQILWRAHTDVVAIYVS